LQSWDFAELIYHGGGGDCLDVGRVSLGPQCALESEEG
jgi:hypothetical protein